MWRVWVTEQLRSSLSAHTSLHICRLHRGMAHWGDSHRACWAAGEGSYVHHLPGVQQDPFRKQSETVLLCFYGTLFGCNSDELMLFGKIQFPSLQHANNTWKSNRATTTNCILIQNKSMCLLSFHCHRTLYKWKHSLLSEQFCFILSGSCDSSKFFLVVDNHYLGLHQSNTS